jgi:hypothetical protein
MSAPQVLPNVPSAHPRDRSPCSVDAKELELYQAVPTHPVATILYAVGTRGGAGWEAFATAGAAANVPSVATEFADSDVGGIGPNDCGTANYTSSIDDFTWRGMSWTAWAWTVADSVAVRSGD